MAAKGTIKTIKAKGVETNLIEVVNRSEIMEFIYPIGSTYITLDGTFDPNTHFQGTWEVIKSGLFLETTDVDLDVGTEVEPGLPNITGAAGRWVSAGGHFSQGALTGGYSGTNINGYGGSGGYMHYGVTLDASKSNPIYGRSDTVQPPAIRCRIWKRVG